MAETGDVEDPASGGLTHAAGWTSTYSTSGGALPKREHFNWLFLVLGALGVEINEHGILEWSGTPAYGHPAVVFGSDDALYISVQDSTNEDPTTDTSDTYWRLLLPDASATVKGLVELATAAQAATGTSSTLAVTPAGLASALPDRVLWLPASSGSAPASNGASPFRADVTGFSYEGMAFDQSTDEHLDFLFPMPSGYGGGDIKWRLYWTATGGSGTVQFDLSMASPGDNGTIGSLSSIGSLTDTKQTNSRMHITGDLTQSANKPSANEPALLRLTRDVSADTLSSDALLLAIRGEF